MPLMRVCQVSAPPYFSKTLDMCMQISFAAAPGVQIGVAFHGGITFDALANAGSAPNFDSTKASDGSWTWNAGLAVSVTFSAMSKTWH